MRIVRVKRGVVVEVLLDVNKRDIVLGEKLAYTSSVGRLVTRHAIVIEDSRKTGNVKGESIECAGGLGEGRGYQGEEGE